MVKHCQCSNYGKHCQCSNYGKHWQCSNYGKHWQCSNYGTVMWVASVMKYLYHLIHDYIIWDR